eukprot:ANDGO_01453.mRNA.1 Glutathione peroxidase
MTVDNMLQLNALAEAYGSQGLAIVATPSNQFYRQMPGFSSDEILNTFKYVRPGSGYVLNGTMLARGDVNGASTLAHYVFLKSACPTSGSDPMFADVSMISWGPISPKDVEWNFAKFLIDRKGVPYKRYPPTVYPKDILQDITKLLQS